MNTLHKSENENKNIVSEEGQRRLLCSYNSSHRCPFSDSMPSGETVDNLLRELASILVEAYLETKNGDK